MSYYIPRYVPENLKERTNKRDLTFSRFHRELPGSFRIMDIDYIAYDSDCNPIACFEEKHANQRKVDLNSTQFKVGTKVANKLEIPFFLLVVSHKNHYEDIDRKHEEFITFRCWPVNKMAKEFFKLHGCKPGLHMSEQGFMRMEACLRQEALNKEQVENVSSDIKKFEFDVIDNE